MRAPRTALIVGNGLSLSLGEHAGSVLGAWNPSDPLGWRDLSGRRLLDHFPRFADAIDDTLVTDPAFARIERVAAKAAARPNIVATELRHYLALAYSTYDRQVAQVQWRQWRTWGWARYLDAIGNGLAIIVSFNYDLVLERLLEGLGIQFGRVGVPDERTGVPILKPHGSIDFEADIRALDVQPEWPITHATDLVHTPLTRLSASERERPRANPEIVPPNEASRIAGFHWVASGYDAFAAAAETLEQCIIAGHNYAEVDRPEINRLLDCLDPRTRVVIANPSPPPDLVIAARTRGLAVVTWQPGPELTEVGQPLINRGWVNRRRRATPPRLDTAPPPPQPSTGMGAIHHGSGHLTMDNIGIMGFDGTAISASPGARLTLKDVWVDQPPRGD